MHNDTAAELRSCIPILLEGWFKAKRSAANAGVTLNTGFFDNVIEASSKTANQLSDELDDSDGIDNHKIAAAIAFNLAQYSNNLFNIPSKSSFSTERSKDNLYVDCALVIFLELLDVDVSSIEGEPKTWETLRVLFLELCTKRYPADVKLTTLLSLSILAFTLERSYPRAV